jgi:hypothetical protein
VKPSCRREMAKMAKEEHGISVELACATFSISESCEIFKFGRRFLLQIHGYNIFLIPNPNEGLHRTLHVAVWENNTIKLGYIDPFGNSPKQGDTEKVITILRHTFNKLGKSIKSINETPHGTVNMQKNGYDCGMFVLYYIRKIKELGNFDMDQLTIKQQDILSFRDWIKKEVIQGTYLPGFTIK